MASPGKVVRIEDVEAQPSGDRVRFREDTFVFSHDGGRASKLRPDSLSQGLVSATASSKTDLSVSHADTNLTVQLQPDPPTASQDARDSAEEMADTVGPLPVGWPKIPALLRRRSCEMSKIMSPCVNKAVSHLELVQNIIDEWFRRAGDDIQSRLSSRQSKASRLSKNTPSRLMLKFGQDTSAVETEIEGNTLGVALSKPHTVSTRSSISSKTELSVLGVGGRLETESDDGDSVSEDGNEAAPAEADVPYLGAEDVIEEVTTLLARLEDDRQNTLNKLHSEERRVENLHKQIEAISLKRLVELPQLVQQEHEACILDVNELQWHVAYSSRSLDRIQNKTNIADVLNQRLKEDIGFVDKHIPLVQEKLELELEAMDKIRQAQIETNKELELILTRQAKTESKSREAHDKAATERAHIERELNAARESLRQICDEYSTATATFNSYTHQCNDIIQQLKDNQQEKLVLEVKNENAKHSEDMQAVKVRDLETLITEAEFEHRRLANENSQLQNDLDSKKTKHSSRVKEMHSQIQHKENELRQLTLKNKEVKMEIQDCQDKIARCEKQKEVDERNMTRIRKELVRTEQQMETIMENFRKVFAINGALRSQLRTDEEKAFKFEENLKQTAETLKQQVKDEVHTRTVLTARIRSDSTDVSRTSEEAIEKKRKVSQVVDEVTTAVVQVEDKVTRLRSAKESKAEKIAELHQKIEEVRNQQKDTDEGVEEQMKVFAPHHKHLKEDILSFDKKLDHIAWRTELMKKNMDDMESSSVMMGRVLEATEKQNKALDEELQELNVQLEAGQKVKNSLKASMQSVEERVHLLDRQQKQFISQRKQHLQSLENNKMEALRMNKEMAGTYRQLQNDAVLLKNDLLDIYEERISMENSIKDLKQLRSLQLRMHGALVEYFKFRGLYNEAEVDKLESESSNNACRVTELQADMNKALSSITRFLQNELVGESNQPLLPTVTPPVKGKQLPRVGTVKS